MAFVPKTWVDEDQAQPGDPALEAVELNRIEQGIADADLTGGGAVDGDLDLTWHSMSTALDVQTSNLTGNPTVDGGDITLNNSLNANGGTIYGLASPAAGDHAATRDYVDAVAASGSGSSLLVVSDLADIPPGTRAGTVVVLSAGAPSSATEVVSSSSVFSGTSFRVVIPAPTGIEDGDLLVAVMANQTTVQVNPAGDMTVLPAGFARVAWPVYPADAGLRWIAAYTKVASGESGDYTFEWATTYGRALGAMLVIRNASAVLGYAGPTTESDNIPLLRQMTVPSGGRLAIGITHTVTTAGNDGRATFTGWDARVQVVGSDWATASSDTLTLVTQACSAGATVGPTLGTLGQGTAAADASAVLVVG